MVSCLDSNIEYEVVVEELVAVLFMSDNFIVKVADAIVVVGETIYTYRTAGCSYHVKNA